MDHLLDLDEKLDFANPTAPSFQIITGSDMCALGEMVSDPGGDLPHVVDHPEIERAAPNERLDGIQEALPQRDVARAGPRADEGRALPRQS